MNSARSALAALAASALALAAVLTADAAHADLKSSNWSGYVAMGFGSTASTASPGMSFTTVAGQWIEPKASCTTGAATSSSVWVGLGGYTVTSNELEQAGTEADCGPDGKPSYYVWYELVPAGSVTVRSMKVFPGDVIRASIVVDHSNVLVQVTDKTRNRRFSRRLEMASPDLSTAEWIVEAPARCGLVETAGCNQSELTNFGKVAFSHTTAVGNGAIGTTVGSNWTTTALQLAPNGSRHFGSPGAGGSEAGGAGATTSAAWNGGRCFSVTWSPS
jgi:Peptidase A4 family